MSFDFLLSMMGIVEAEAARSALPARKGPVGDCLVVSFRGNISESMHEPYGVLPGRYRWPMPLITTFSGAAAPQLPLLAILLSGLPVSGRLLGGQQESDFPGILRVQELRLVKRSHGWKIRTDAHRTIRRSLQLATQILHEQEKVPVMGG
jgi:hypothetical protein